MDQKSSPQDYSGINLPTSKLAITSLITGIVGFILPIPFVLGIAAVWTGIAARKVTRANPPTAKGDGLATAGIILGWIEIILAVCAFLYLGFFYVLG